jgi:hypothetical protein
MPQLLKPQLIGGEFGDIITQLYVGQTPGNVLQVAPDGKSLILGPVPANTAGATGPTGPGVGSTGPVGPAGPAIVASVGTAYELFTTPGQFSWTVPSNVDNIIINAVGGGGGGAEGLPGFSGDQLVPDTSGQTGQSGGSLRVSAQVTPGSVITGTIGRGGLGANRVTVLNATPGTATSVGPFLSVNGDFSVSNILCNGGIGGGITPFFYGVGWFDPTARASTTPTGLVSPMIAQYGLGGIGGLNLFNANIEGLNGGNGAVMIEYVTVV